MAFHTDAKRELNLNPNDIDINTSPGMYNVKSKSQSRTFNVKEIPFGTKEKKKSVFDPKPWEVNEPRSQLQQIEAELRVLKLEEKKNKKLHNKRHYGIRASSKKKDKKRVVSIPDRKRSKSVQSVPDPGKYYKDPVKEKIKKIYDSKIAKEMSRILKKKHDKYLNEIRGNNIGRSPSIPEKRRRFGYHRTKGKENNNEIFYRRKPSSES